MRLFAGVDSTTMRRAEQRGVETKIEPTRGDSPLSQSPLQQRRAVSQRQVAERPASDALAAPVESLPQPEQQPQTDTAKRKSKGMQFSDIIEGKATDSVVFDARNKMIYSYKEGNVSYQGMNLKADFMSVNMETKNVFAHGLTDSIDGVVQKSHPEFSDGGSPYSMDTITYNLDSRKAVIKGIATQEGDGWLIGSKVKMQPDGSIHIGQGVYTTCDHTDHPHFYLAMTQAKVIPGKKIITGPAYLVLEDVPIYFACIPEGFFPINLGPKSGLLMPSYGEDASRGFFIRGLGYYFILSKHIDLALTGGI